MNPINVGTQTIETERLILRRFVMSDVHDMFKNWINDKEVQSNYGEPVYENTSLVKVLQKSKMKYEGTLRQSSFCKEKNEYDDRIYYGILRTDY